MASCNTDGLEELLGRAGLETPIPDFAGANILHNLQDVFKVYLADALHKTVNCGRVVAYDAILPSNMTGGGDLVVVAPKLRISGIKHDDLVTELAEKLPSGPPFAPPFCDGIRLRVISSNKTLARLAPAYIIHRKRAYGFDDTIGRTDSQAADSPKKRIVVEFSSPNVAGDFAPRHLRSTMLGAFVANLYEGMGWDVVRMNYLGDWGKPLGLLTVGYKEFGSDDDLNKDPMRHLLEVNDKINEKFKPEKEASKILKSEKQDLADLESQGLFAEQNEATQRLETGDAELLALWQKFRDVSIEQYAAAHDRMGIIFDERSGESQVSAESVAEVENALKEKGVYELQSDGGWTIDFAKHNAKGLTMAVMRYRDGTTGYPLRDVAAVLDRAKTHSFDRMVYVVEAKQDTHFLRIHKILELMDRSDLSEKIQHLHFGDVTGLNGDFAKCRLLDDYLDEARDLAKESLINEEEGVFLNQEEETLDRLGMAALIAQDLSHRRTASYAMDAKKMAGFAPDTGVRFQNCYAQLAGVLAGQPAIDDVDLDALEYDTLETEYYSDLLRIMVQFPDVVSGVYKVSEPSHIVLYLTRLVEQIEIALLDDDEQEWEGKDEAVKARMVMYEAARQVLENAMRLLGMQPCGT
ncbi:tRNA synthetases class I (R) domain-containing protein [Sarocladium implicatum]|nr:tRNA synthetases class I (R) domain-containing protein [Sarocladium implicatum]